MISAAMDTAISIGSLPDLSQAHRATHPRHDGVVVAAFAQAVLELDPFGLRADQAEPGEIIALEDGGGQFRSSW